jgi:hypothetical protein
VWAFAQLSCNLLGQVSRFWFEIRFKQSTASNL